MEVDMISFVIGLFNLYVGHMLREVDTKIGRLLCAGNYILAGSNFTVAIQQLV